LVFFFPLFFLPIFQSDRFKGREAKKERKVNMQSLKTKSARASGAETRPRHQGAAGKLKVACAVGSTRRIISRGQKGPVTCVAARDGAKSRRHIAHDPCIQVATKKMNTRPEREREGSRGDRLLISPLLLNGKRKRKKGKEKNVQSRNL
jgi:hypothetical protein